MRKLTQDEYDILIRIAAYGRDGSVSFDSADFSYAPLRKVLHALVKKGMLAPEEFDGVTRYQLTARGREGAEMYDLQHNAP